ncbi:MAG: hypothetical protein JKY48_09015 [Flavobacteriales bacterium]|nr:hypothetical protein [Flavobacteriales bacterium]
MKRFIAVVVSLVLWSVIGNAQEFEARLNNNEIKIGEQTFIEFECRFSAAESEIMMPALKDTITKFVEIIEVSDIDTTFDEDDISFKIFLQRVTITSWDSGLHVIPPFKVKIGDQTYESEALLLTVNTIQIEAEQDIKDIKTVLEVPFSLWDWILARKWIIAGIFGAIVLLIILILIYKKYSNRPTREEDTFVPKEAADLLANRKLQELEDNKVWQKGNVKEYHSKLSFIVREYIENRFELRALEQTTDEIILLLGGVPEIDKVLKAKLNQLLLLADMAKFAKQQPIAVENEEVLKTAYSFIKKTKLIVVEQEQGSENSETNA